MEQAVASAKKDLWMRRQVVKAIFYGGTKALAEGGLEAFGVDMATCCGLDKPILEFEWYLARQACEG